MVKDILYSLNYFQTYPNAKLIYIKISIVQIQYTFSTLNEFMERVNILKKYGHI